MSPPTAFALTDFGRSVAAENLGLAGRSARLLGGDHEPDDAMSEACVALCRAVARHDPARGKLSTLTHWVARSRFSELRKARSRRPALKQPGDDLVFDVPAPGGADPDEHLELHRALATLERRRPQDAVLLRRHYFDGVPQKTLAAELGCGRKALCMRLHAARLRLRKILEGEPS